MICIDQQTGEKSREPLLTLSQIRDHKTTFGILLKHVSQYQSKSALSVNDKLVVLA